MAPLPSGFESTGIRPMVSEAMDAETAGGEELTPSQRAKSPGAPGTGMQGLPPGVRDTLVSADTVGWNVP
jgi:hypothetical protein